MPCSVCCNMQLFEGWRDTGTNMLAMQLAQPSRRVQCIRVNKELQRLTKQHQAQQPANPVPDMRWATWSRSTWPYRVPTTFPCDIPLVITETQLGTACTCFQFSSFSVQRANPFQPGGSAHQSASADARKHAHTQWLLAQGPRMFCFLAKHSHFEYYGEAPGALVLASSLLGLPNSVRIPSICSNSLLFRETGKYILLKL
jgi:hypothetical protein